VLKALAAYYDLALGELIEDLVVGTFAGRKPLSAAALTRAAELMSIYGLDLNSLPAARRGEVALGVVGSPRLPIMRELGVILQDGLNCTDGFREATDILDREGQAAIKERFSDLQLAINVLKHGRGRSYDALVAKAGGLPFRLKLPGQSFFYEGDVSEISTLIEVDDTFVSSCAEVIREVSETIRRVRPEFPL
jgi:hypothetical protein